MKLTIKELAPYLPYKLNYQLKGNFPIKKGAENIIEDIREINIYNFTLKKVLEWESCKPILRPLSDLTKDEYFKLSNTLENESFGFWYGKDINGIYIHFEGYSSRDYKEDGFKSLPYYAMEFLFKNHFDIFGLIEKNLAIDINTLKQ